MDEVTRNRILEKAKTFFRKTIIKNHSKKLKDLGKVEEFNINPFLYKYLANFLCGDSSPESVAKTLIYPRLLGTSISTSFGTQLQKFISQLEEISTSGTVTSGMDIEFIDALDGRKKYCQIKSSTQTINKDDVKTIKDHFQGVKDLARTNNMNIGLNDLVVGVLYGDCTKEMPKFYEDINHDYKVFIGQDFWHHITGDETFYQRLIRAFEEVAEEINYSQRVEEKINELAENIRSKGL